MSKSICGIDCMECEICGTCRGCLETDGRPFGGTCIVAECRRRGDTALDELKGRLTAALRALEIPDMEEATDFHALKGSYVNLSYELPNGQLVKFWDDNKIYLGNQLHKCGSERCYGVVADEKYLMVAEYGCSGTDAELVVFCRWNPMNQ